MFKYIIKKLKETRGDIGSLFGGGGNSVQNLALPTFQTDPNFTSSQNSLATLGQQVLGGNLQGMYSDLGKSDSPQFQAMVQNVTGQTQQAAQQQEAASGTGRSGVGAASSALALNNVIPGLNYQDLLNAQSQQGQLLTFGGQVTQDVAGNALTNQSQENNFAQQNFQNSLNMDEYNNAYSLMQGNATGQAIGTTIGAIGGGLIGGPAGALAGAGLGSSLTGGSGGGSGLSSLLSAMNTSNNSYAGSGITSNTAPAVPGLGGYNANLQGLTFASGA
jgi:hypothetical protein